MKKTRGEPKQHYALVEVIWEDAAAMESGWSVQIEVKPILIRSVGFLVVCNKQHVVVAMDTCTEGEHNGRTQIPRGMVRSMKVLRRADA